MLRHLSSSADNTGEPEENLLHCPELISAFREAQENRGEELKWGEDSEWEESEEDISPPLFEAGTIGDLYSLDEINDFLNDSFGKSTKVSEYFTDGNKFIRSAAVLQKMVGLDVLDAKKRYRLKRLVTSLNKASKKNKRVVKPKIY